MVVLKDPVAPLIADINSRKFSNSVVKTSALYAELQQFTQSRQAPILDFLASKKVTGAKGFWITNRILVPGATLELVQGLVQTFEQSIEIIREQIVVPLEDTKPDSPPAPRPQKVLEWGVQKIEADKAWAAGVDGTGVVVATTDTGVRATHQAFAGARRPQKSWLDPILGSEEPEDTQGHGTHVMGTIVGRDGTGVAPGAQFIACVGCGAQGCPEGALLDCAQFTTCPTNPDGSDADCALKATVSSNSWGGGNEQTWYDDPIAVYIAADIVPLFAIGNAGPGCRSANSPGDRPTAISVGATTRTDTVASFSSHGPTLISARIKPEVSAPGQGIRSASSEGDDLYVEFSGTSMATPHVAGVIALLRSKSPSSSISQVQQWLESTAEHPRIESIVCTGGGVNITNPWPNNSFGNGRVSALKAVNAATSG
jgi:subtilisin family serine protease